MRNILPLFLVFTSLTAIAGSLYDPKEVPWLGDLKQAKVFFFHVCGSENILPMKKSLNRDFAFGAEDQGFFFTQTPSAGEYFSMLETQGLDEAKASFTSQFEKAHLWRHSKSGLVDLGAPTKIELPFKATIKDCMAGSKNSHGMECRPDLERRICCYEKFIGPRIYWGANQEYILKYSPDPSVKLKVPGESKNRYCNFQQIIEIRGSGR
jgi:hypothetical protein